MVLPGTLRVGGPMDGVVCVVDGDPGVRTSLTALLHTIPVRVAAFSTGEEFLDHLADGIPVFLIIELRLPGMTGLEVLKALGDSGVQIPTLALTGEVDSDLARTACEREIVPVLEKPFVSWAVVRRVQETLGLPISPSG